MTTKLEQTTNITLWCRGKPTCLVKFGCKLGSQASCDLNSPQSRVYFFTPYIIFQVLSKRKYLCLEDYDEPYFDFHCTEERPGKGEHWYTICGTPYENRMEYIVIICTVCFLGLTWFWQMLRGSGPLQGTKHHHHHHHHKGVKQN